MDSFLNVFFFVFHSLWIAFCLFAWLWKKTRLANLVIIFLTGFSWTFLGIWYGFGYCPSTDWHWQVRAKLGCEDMPSSYTKFLIDSLTGLDVDSRLIDAIALTCLGLAFIASTIVNIKDWKETYEKRQR